MNDLKTKKALCAHKGLFLIKIENYCITIFLTAVPSLKRTEAK
jgi:hypothetical protein